MPVNALFAAPKRLWPEHGPALERAFADAGLDVSLSMQIDPRETDYLIYAPGGEVEDFAPFIRAKAVLSLWAGVEAVADNPTLSQPLARMADEGLALGMREWVAGHVLRSHLGLDLDVLGQDGKWRPRVPPLARDRCVGILGLGHLGRACAEALVALGFAVCGWSRTPGETPGVLRHCGAEGLEATLARSEILVVLLPLTRETAGILDARAMSLLPRGAAILNPGRGALIDDDALLAALDSGQVGHATLDVFATEPLPPEHPYWVHPRVTVTPHIAANTRPDTSAAAIAENIRRGEAGEPFLNLVDRRLGY